MRVEELPVAEIEVGNFLVSRDDPDYSQEIIGIDYNQAINAHDPMIYTLFFLADFRFAAFHPEASTLVRRPRREVPMCPKHGTWYIVEGVCGVNKTGTDPCGIRARR